MKAAAALMRFAAVILITVILGSAQTGCGSGGTQSVRDNTETLHQQPEEWFYDSFERRILLMKSRFRSGTRRERPQVFP